MSLSQYFYVPGNPEFISYQGKCWRRMSGQSLAGDSLVPGIDVEVHDTINECLGITDLHEIAELEALVKVSPGGSSFIDPTSEIDMDIFYIRDLSFIAETSIPSETITLETILAGTPYFALADISIAANYDHYPLSHSYNVYTDNNLDPVTDPPNYIPRSGVWVNTILPDVLSFHSGLPS
jgi:hypothetical protein